MSPETTHETITTSRTIEASPAKVFNAWADPEARAMWGPPSSDEAIEFLESDFRAGGMDVHLCGTKGDLCFRVETLYHDIQAPLRLLFTERVSTGDAVLCASLITVELAAASGATKLQLAVQVASLVGKGLVEGNRRGWTAALDNLDTYLISPEP